MKEKSFIMVFIVYTPKLSSLVAADNLFPPSNVHIISFLSTNHDSTFRSWYTFSFALALFHKLLVAVSILGHLTYFEMLEK
jgi:hypothetical protein